MNNNFLIPSTPVRQRPCRESKDKANLKIALSCDNDLIKSTKVTRSKSILFNPTTSIRRVKSQINVKSKRIEIEIDEKDSDYAGEEGESEDDDDSSEFNSESSDSTESDSDCSIDSTELSLANHFSRAAKINTPTVKRAKSCIRPRKSISVPTRERVSNNNNNISSKEDSLAVTRGKLHVGSLPDDFPCRENEFDNVYNFIYDNVSKGTSGCMFISGVPGTGKTATVTAAIRCFEESEKTLIRKVVVNAMHVTEPRQVYLLIYQELTKNKVAAKHAVSALEKELFARGKTRTTPILILIDEIDQLCNKKQDVLYKIFSWLKHKGSRLVLITISNTMDLADRVLHHKVASRLGVTRLAFEPYTPQQLIEIITSRMSRKELETRFDPKAIELAARKVAALSGDARRALDICRRAVDMQEEDKKIDVASINKVIKEMYSSPNIVAIKQCCSYYEKLFLRAVAVTFKSQGFDEAILEDVMERFYNLCKSEGVSSLNCTQIFGVVSCLATYKLLTYDSIHHDIRLKLRLECSRQDVDFALDNSVSG